MIDKKGETKLLVLIISVVIVLSSCIFILAQENNSLTYSNNDLTVTIKNSQNQELGQATLSSHKTTDEVRHVWGGKDKIVMWYDFNGWSEYSNGLGQVTFKDMNNGKEVEKSYYFAKRVLYEECTEIGSALNGSLRTVCTEKERWDRLNINDIPAGNTRIGLITDVDKGDFYDGVWIIAGMKIEKHAQWDYIGDTITITGDSGIYDMTLIENNNTILIVDRNNNSVRKYFINNKSSGGAFGVFESPCAIASNPTYFWIGDAANTVHRYFMNFTVSADGNWSTYAEDSNDNIRGVAYCNEYLYVGNNNNQKVYKYNTAGVYQNIVLDLKGNNSEQTQLAGLDCDGAHLFATAFNGETYMYWLNGTYMDIHSNALAGDNDNGRGAVATYYFYYRNDYADNLIYIYETIDVVPPEMTTPLLNSTDGTNRSNQNLNCVFTLTDDKQTNLAIYWKWYKNGIINLSGSKNVSNNSVTTLTLLAGNTTKNDNWTCEILPSDWYNNGTIENSSSIWVLNTEPDTPIQLTPANASGYGMNSIVPFKWQNSNDEDGDSLTYKLEIYNESNMASANLVYSNNSISQGTGNTSINITLSDYTTKDDDYYWRVRANDGQNNGSWSENRTFQYANWTITFNLTDSVTGIPIDTSGPQYFFNVLCDNGVSNSSLDNPFIAIDGFSPGTWFCEFYTITASPQKNYIEKNQSFNADGNKLIQVSVSLKAYLTAEEHTWLEAIYECIINKDCDLYNLLLEINTTVGNIWEYTSPTDESVVLDEVITNKAVNSTNNLTINYSINVPVKAGYATGTYLPVRIGYWFLDETNTTCYNQGDKPTGVDEPYCQPLIINTIGPMGGTVNFTVELQPLLANGSAYSIKRTIDIDPNNVWISYGQEIIGSFITTEILATYGASVKNTGEVMPGNFLSRITGAITGISNSLLSGWQIVLIIAIPGLVLIVFIISRTILKIKGK
jgi:hypothetical protein